MTKQITHNNHYVPRFYLRYWSTNGNTIYAFNGIIKHKACSGWKSSSIRKTACWPDYYTDEISGQDDDKVEHIFQRYEDAAKPSFEIVRLNQNLSKNEMEALIDFLICQLVRTPSFYHLTQRQTKDCFAETLRETVAKIEQGNRSAVQKNRTPELATLANTLFPLKVEVDQKNNFIKASTALGRHGFLSAALNFLEGEVAQLLRNSNWTILRSSRFFLTSDNPVVIMQRRGMTTTVGFEGGLVSFLTYVYLPLTPNHLLVTRIGSTREEANSMTLSPGLFDLFQKGSIYNARRYIYAKQKDDLVSKLRPQNVDQLAFENLEYEKSTWHSSQIELEKEFFQNSNEGQQSS